ncbi:MAG TPA: HAMP domain-containing sensor histidine kinase [Solirubrobacteraceae bacterium]|nr:HAMP domain-containing sensor histidine kinase [Solirubrobacteraceae bacterium]
MSLRSRLTAALFYVLLLAIVAFGVPLALNLRARVNAEVRTQAQAQADLVAATAADLLQTGDRPELTTLAHTGARSIRGRVIIVDAAGRVLSDSEDPSTIGSSYASRPEVAAALRGRPVQLSRGSRTLGEQILATAVPIVRNDHTVGAVRVTQSVAAVSDAVTRAELGLVLIAVIVLALGLAAGLVLANQVAGPIGGLERVARRVAQGDLSARAAIEGSREQRSLAASFNEMTERIARLLGVQRTFVADASHQLRTPLTGLRLRIEAARHAAGAGTVDGELDAALGEVDRLARTVDELLVLSRAGERRTEGARVDLVELARDTCARWQPRARDRDMNLGLGDLPAEPVTVWAARDDLERCLDALVENAVRYAPDGTRVVIGVRDDAIVVRDHGPGIEADERERVFERFHRGRAAGSAVRGSGLGLPIARELARAWGGDVTLHAAPEGVGLLAILRLPVTGRPPEGTLTALNPSASTVPSP